jgi:hypothetical protein
MNVQLRGVSRARWAAVGAAIAVSIGGGGIAISQAAVSSGERSVYTPIVPCRAFDTRSGVENVGSRSTPIGAGQTLTQQITGANGNCTTPIPADASAVAMNVTVVGGTESSFLTIWPSDVTPRPVASSLNWLAGDPPTPNNVDTKLSATGQINLFNHVGDVDVLADIVGYYSDHNHDDRYYPRAETYNRTEVDSQFATKAEVEAVPVSHLIAGGYIFGVNGNLDPEKQFGDMQTSRLDIGTYQITLPGYNAECFGAPTPFLTASGVGPSSVSALSDPGTTTDCVSGDVSLLVHTTMESGPIDQDFTFAIYAGR